MPAVPFSPLRDFMLNGKGNEYGTFQPTDPEVDEVVNVLETGLSGKHLASGVFRFLPFDGVDGTGEAPDLTCALTGALENDTVAAIIDTADFSDARALFDSGIATADEIEQVSLTNLSAKTYLALLIAK